MRVVLTVASYRHTGSAAVAEYCCRALSEVGVESRLIFQAGDNLEERLADQPWAHAALVKERSFGRLISNLRAIQKACAQADAVVSFLTHDLVLCVLARVHRSTPLIRSYRKPSHFRRDLLHRWLAKKANGALLAHSQMEDLMSRELRDLPRFAAPVATEQRFNPNGDGSTWRTRLGISENAPVLGMVGKLAAGRGFELLLDTAAQLGPLLHVIVVGHGELQPQLEAQAQGLGLTPRLHWAGYQETELPDLFHAMDVVLYPAVGSDHGHRAISEAQACGRPVVAVNLPGVTDLIEHGRNGLIVESSVTALSTAVQCLFDDPELADSMRVNSIASVRQRRFDAVGTQLTAFIERVIAKT